MNSLHTAGESWLRALVSGRRLYKMTKLTIELSRSGGKREGGEILFYRHGASKNILYEEPWDEEKIARVNRIYAPISPR